APDVDVLHLERDVVMAKGLLVALEHPLRALPVGLPVRFGHRGADLLVREGFRGLEQQPDEVQQSLERLHRAASYRGLVEPSEPRMIRLRRGVVTSLGEARRGAHDLEVAMEGTHQLARAIAYPDLVGPVTTGDEVLLNTTAVELGLGTGGVHLVIAVL